MASTQPASIAQLLRNAEIPGYTTGQVIPACMEKHLAILDNNNHETEVVSPLSMIRQARKEALVETLLNISVCLDVSVMPVFMRISVNALFLTGQLHHKHTPAGQIVLHRYLPMMGRYDFIGDA